MKTIKLQIELTYDDTIIHGNDLEAIRWFKEEVLGDDLILHSNLIGDEIGAVKVIVIE